MSLSAVGLGEAGGARQLGRDRRRDGSVIRSAAADTDDRVRARRIGDETSAARRRSRSPLTRNCMPDAVTAPSLLSTVTVPAAPWKMAKAPSVHEAFRVLGLSVQLSLPAGCLPDAVAAVDAAVVSDWRRRPNR